MDLMKELEDRREIIDARIQEIFADGRDHPLWRSMSYYPEAGGKRLRPFLAMISAGALGEDEEKAVPYGIALEFVHNFTLVHDDIMDQDQKRRGRPTLHRKIGDAQAINAGDGLFALAFEILSQTEIEGERIRKLLKVLSSSVVKIAEGQQEDLKFEKTYDISEEEFIEMIEKKTAYLFEAATIGGAIIANASSEEIDAMERYAKKMGIAFQIQDDYLDLMGDEEEIGKDVGSDIRAGKRTLMVIRALSELPESKKERLIDILEKDDLISKEIKEALDLMAEGNALEYARELAETYAEEAKKELDHLPDTEQKNILEELVDYMIQRSK